jgi:hypothetical protein
MVDLVVLQSVSYVAAAIGVCSAAVYYAMTLREQRRNRKVQLSTSISDILTTKEYLNDFYEVAYLDWTDVEDFMKRYDSSVNKESFVQRFSIWQTYDNIGYLIREGLVDPNIVYDAAGYHCIMIWGRYKAIINNVSRPELGPRAWENFEYFAHMMWRIARERGAFSRASAFDVYRDVYEPMDSTSP